jgi:hypothetical protein
MRQIEMAFFMVERNSHESGLKCGYLKIIAPYSGSRWLLRGLADPSPGATRPPFQGYRSG